MKTHLLEWTKRTIHILLKYSLRTPWDRGQIGIQVLCRKRISMLTGLKASPLACKCVFYGLENNAKGDPMELNLQET